MKQKIIYLLFIGILFSITLVSSCMSDIQCPGQGNDICQNKQLSHYNCIDGSCQKTSEVGFVECCSPSDCDRDQMCSNNYECVGGSPYNTPINSLENNQIESNTDNSLSPILIIALAIIIGFIILAATLSKKKK